MWQMMMAVLHSNRQLKTERYGDRERILKTCCTVQQKTTDDSQNFLIFT